MTPHNNVASSSMVCDFSCFIYMVTEYLRKIFPKDFLLRWPFFEHNEVRWCTWWQNHNQFLKWGTVWKMARYGVFSSPYFPVFSPNAGKYGPEKLRIWTLFTQWKIIAFNALLMSDFYAWLKVARLNWNSSVSCFFFFCKSIILNLFRIFSPFKISMG